MEKKKVLFVATVVKTHIVTFHLPFLKMFQEMGYETSVAARNDYEDPVECKIPYCDKYYDIPFERSPLKAGNLKAYKKLKEVIDNNNFDIIHCHTPVGGVLGRICAIKSRKRGTKVFYTAHGFHFYKGAPLKNWMIYYPIERLCAHFTDILITINKEDYALAQKKMKGARVEYVPGVGIDLEKFGNAEADRINKHHELGIPENAKLLLSVGELNKNKNHETVIRAIADMEDIYYIIAGKGEMNEHLQNVIGEFGIADRVKLLGFCKDVVELCKTADVFVFPSFREGLSLSVMEAMASGLPVACSRIRGNTDLIDENGGVMFDPHSVDDCKKALEKMLAMDLKKLGEYNMERIKDFEIGNVIEQIKGLYAINKQ